MQSEASEDSPIFGQFTTAKRISVLNNETVTFRWDTICES